jgi:hypothetical protein
VSECLRCGEPAVSFWRKQRLGLGQSVACRHCEARLYVRWIYGLAYMLVGAVAPLAGGLALAAALDPSTFFSGLVLFVLGAIATVLALAWLYHRFAPLSVRDA